VFGRQLQVAGRRQNKCFYSRQLQVAGRRQNTSVQQATAGRR
jgi:hypothetical protein